MERTRLAPGPPALALAALIPVLALPGEGADQAPAPILGIWRGTSTCTDRKFAPACKDEQVIYHFVPIAGKPATTVRLEADKLVDGVPERMGEFDFTLDAGTGRWNAEFQNTRYHGRWSFAIDGNRLTGTLVDVPTGTLVRRVATVKD